MSDKYGLEKLLLPINPPKMLFRSSRLFAAHGHTDGRTNGFPHCIVTSHRPTPLKRCAEIRLNVEATVEDCLKLC